MVRIIHKSISVLFISRTVRSETPPSAPSQPPTERMWKEHWPIRHKPTRTLSNITTFYRHDISGPWMEGISLNQCPRNANEIGDARSMATCALVRIMWSSKNRRTPVMTAPLWGAIEGKVWDGRTAEIPGARYVGNSVT